MIGYTMYVDQPAAFFTLSIPNRDSLQLCAPGEGVFLQSLKKLLKKQLASMMYRKSAPAWRALFGRSIGNTASVCCAARAPPS